MSLPKGRILVVDDDPRLLGMLTDTLDSIGYDTLAATDGIEALSVLQQEGADRFDLLITDIKMPNMDGLSLLKRIRRHYPSLPVLFITGFASDEMVTEAGPDGYLAKPFRIERLEELIEDTLERQANGGPAIHQRRVLIRVDGPAYRDLLTDALTCANYVPFISEDENTVMQELEHGEFDAVITSIEKPTEEGKHTLKIVTKRFPDLPVVALSRSYTRDELFSDEQPFKVSGFVRHPFTIAELLSELDQSFGPRPAD